MENEVFIYCVDNSDTITRVSGNWGAFASDNAWSCDPGMVVGHSLWEFIEGEATRQLYEEILNRVRGGVRAGPIPFRCDSPAQRRFLRLTITQEADGKIEFRSEIVRTEARPPVQLLDCDAPRSAQYVRICSMCKMIAISENMWVETEEGLKRLKIFEADELPRLTHGLCPECYTAAMAALDEAGAPD